MARPFAKAPDIGIVFTYLTVAGNRFVVKNNGINYSYIPVTCRCGSILSVKMTALIYGRKKSCGCLAVELLTDRQTTMRGLSRTKEYRAWSGMIKRCSDPKYKLYHRYGGRGIKVCERWFNSLDAFITDMGHCPPNKNSIDRFPNNDGNYEPGNCRWATDEEQCNNRSTCRFFEINGRTQTLKQWCDFYNIGYKLVYARISKCGWSIEKALSEPKIDSKYK